MFFHCLSQYLHISMYILPKIQISRTSMWVEDTGGETQKKKIMCNQWILGNKEYNITI